MFVDKSRLCTCSRDLVSLSDSENLSLVGASKRKERESSDHDAPLISLDERLREITGEPPPEEPPADSSPKLQEEVTETNHVSFAVFDFFLKRNSINFSFLCKCLYVYCVISS